MPDYYLDITKEVCPITFVKTKLLIERMVAGEVAEIRLNGGEPLDNVPRALAELGHEVLGVSPEGEGGSSATVYRLRVRRSG